MRKLNKRINLDRANDAADNASQQEATMRNASKKTPWHLRLKGMAATAGVAVIYGLLFASILLAPLPSGKVQAQCAEFDPNDCAHPCYVPRPDYNNDEFHDATSREDCDRILQEVLEDINDRWEEIEAAGEAAYECDKTYERELKTNDLQHRLNMARAANTASEIFLECMGLGGAAAGGTASGGWVIKTIKRTTVTVTRFGVAAGFTLVVGIGTFAICKKLRSDTAQDEVDAANNLKEHADELALKKRDRCREDTNYDDATRQYRRWKGPHKSRRGRWLPSVRQKLQDQARADHQKCLEQFPVGDCGTTE